MIIPYYHDNLLQNNGFGVMATPHVNSKAVTVTFIFANFLKDHRFAFQDVNKSLYHYNHQCLFFYSDPPVYVDLIQKNCETH